MKDSTPIQDKGRFKKIILLEDTPAYYLDAEGNLTEKGAFKKGKILKVDSETLHKQADGSNVFLVMSIRHRNMFIPVNKKNAQYLTIQHIKDLAIEKMKVFDGMKDNEVYENLGTETKNMEAHINDLLEADAPNADVLCTYYEGAFSSADGFDFAGHLDEAFEKRESTPVVKSEELIETQIAQTQPSGMDARSDEALGMISSPRTQGRAFGE